MEFLSTTMLSLSTSLSSTAQYFLAQSKRQQKANKNCMNSLAAVSDLSLESVCDEEKQLVVDCYLNVKFCLSVLLSCYRL
jgi:hypothetical protein